jgi:MATE family multidrug resistance protein
MGGAGIVFVTVPEAIARVFSPDPDVIAASATLLRIAAVFQLSDATQAVMAGALRGAGDTRSTLTGNLFGHYLVGLPLSLLLTFELGWGASGLWWGLSAGLTAVAAYLASRFIWLMKRPTLFRV